jgi:hypothetical protein
MGWTWLRRNTRLYKGFYDTGKCRLSSTMAEVMPDRLGDLDTGPLYGLVRTVRNNPEIHRPVLGIRYQH